MRNPVAQVVLTEPTLEALRNLAQKSGHTVSGLIASIVNEWLKRKERKK